MIREFWLKLRAKMQSKILGKYIIGSILRSHNLQNTDVGMFQLYKKIFAKSQKSKQRKIILSHIGKVYENGFKAIHDFNLEIHEHEFISLLGPSGCGKTTILRMIAGLELISEGELKMGGVTMNSSLPKERGLAMVFQNYALYPYMTVYENIAFGLKIRTYDNAISRALLNKALEALNPFYLKKKYIQAQIYAIKHKNKTTLTELKLLIAKEKKVGTDTKKLVELKTRYQQLKADEKKYLLEKGEQQIEKLKKDLIKYKNSLTTTKSTVNKAEFSKYYSQYIESLVIWRNTIPVRINYFAQLVGIQDYLRRKPAALSGGQRQRVALVRAISKDASLFLFDEPLSNLDAKLRGSMRTEIRQLHDALSSSSIFVTHDQIEAMTMSGRIVLMNKGYIQQVGTPSELFNLPANVFVADFIGSPSINFIDGKLLNDTTISVGNKKIIISKKTKPIIKQMQKHIGQKIIIGIRPQNVITDHSIVNHTKENLFIVQVLSVESIGHENIVHVKSVHLGLFKLIGGRYFVPKKGEKIKIVLDPNTIQIFETKHGFSISAIPNDVTLQARTIWEASVDERLKNVILSTQEKSKEKLSRKILKDLYGIVDKRYGKKRKEERQKIKNIHKFVKEESLIQQIAKSGGN